MAVREGCACVTASHVDRQVAPCVSLVLLSVSCAAATAAALASYPGSPGCGAAYALLIAQGARKSFVCTEGARMPCLRTMPPGRGCAFSLQPCAACRLCGRTEASAGPCLLKF